MQALIKGSGLLSRGWDNDARQTQLSKKRGSTSPASMQGTGFPSPEASTPADLPKRTEQVSLEHTVRGLSPVTHTWPTENDPEDAAASIPALVSQPPVSRRLPKSESSTLHSSDTEQAQHIAMTTNSTASHHVMEAPPTEEVSPQNQAWRTLAALSDSYDRSAANPQLGVQHGTAYCACLRQEHVMQCAVLSNKQDFCHRRVCSYFGVYTWCIILQINFTGKSAVGKSCP